MNRFTKTTAAALAAFVALGSVAAHATELRADGALNTAGKYAVEAGNVYTTQELMVAGLNETDVIELDARDSVQVRAGDVHSPRELAAIGLDANELVTVSDFGSKIPAQTGFVPGALRTDR